MKIEPLVIYKRLFHGSKHALSLGQLGGKPKIKSPQVLFCFWKCMKASWTLKDNNVTLLTF
jgi:hypothetical protein